MAKYLGDTKYILFEVKDRIARITLNRPEKRNALHPPMLAELRDALIEADALVDVNVIILEGAGKDFCAGYDLAGAYAGFKDGETLMCDLIICTEEAKIGFPATRANGTPPSQMWIYHVGPQWAKRIMMTGDCLWGRDAARIGLVLDAVPADQLDAEVNELARRISFVDGELLSAHKRIINAALELQGAKTLQRFAAEMDARAHLSKGPRRTQFRTDMAEHGLKTALKNRDEPFGDGMVKVHWLNK
jgi:enoyl-CoA hydratase